MCKEVVDFLKCIDWTHSHTDLGTFWHWLLVQRKHFPRTRSHKAGPMPCFVPSSYPLGQLFYRTISRMIKPIS